MICAVHKLEGRLSRDIENCVNTHLCKLHVIFRTRDLRGVLDTQMRGFAPKVVGRVHCCSAFVAPVPFLALTCLLSLPVALFVHRQLACYPAADYHHHQQQNTSKNNTNNNTTNTTNTNTTATTTSTTHTIFVQFASSVSLGKG